MATEDLLSLEEVPSSEKQAEEQGPVMGDHDLLPFDEVPSSEKPETV